MSEPQEMPADAPQEPAGRKKTCKECSGSGKKPSRFLGTPDDPCPVCAGRGLIEVVEEPLTPWQQEVVTLLRRIAVAIEHLEAHETGNLLPKTPRAYRQNAEREARRNAR